MTEWTIRLALVCLVAALGLGSGRDPSSRRWRVHRGLWTAGCVLAWIHVALAFHFYHGWSYAHAAQETSRRTAEVVGRSWGGEIWFNFAFIALWAIDAACRWAKPESISRLAVPSAAIQTYLLFIAFNATVVFEGGVVQAGGIAGSVFLAITLMVRFGLSRRRRDQANASAKPAL